MKAFLLTVVLTCSVLTLSAQDGNISQMAANARSTSRTPEGDRSHYGLLYKDKLLSGPIAKPKFASPEDSIRRRGEFVTLCGKAFLAYDDKDALSTVLYGDSALRTGFDNAQLYFYMGFSYEQLGDYKRAEQSFKAARSRDFPGAKMALKAFRQRMKERKEKNGRDLR